MDRGITAFTTKELQLLKANVGRMPLLLQNRILAADSEISPIRLQLSREEAEILLDMLDMTGGGVENSLRVKLTDFLSQLS